MPQISASQMFVHTLHETMDALGMTITDRTSAPHTIESFINGVREVCADGGTDVVERHLKILEDNCQRVYNNSPVKIGRKATIVRYLAVITMVAAVQYVTSRENTALRQHWLPVSYIRPWSKHEGKWNRKKCEVYTVTPSPSHLGTDWTLHAAESPMSKNSILHNKTRRHAPHFDTFVEGFFENMEFRYSCDRPRNGLTLAAMVPVHQARVQRLDGSFLNGDVSSIFTAILDAIDAMENVFVHGITFEAATMPFSVEQLPVFHSVRYGKVVVYPVTPSDAVIVSERGTVSMEHAKNLVIWFTGKLLHRAVSTGKSLYGVTRQEAADLSALVGSLKSTPVTADPLVSAL